MWRRNPEPKKLKIKNGEIILACQHAFDSLFDQDFEEGTLPVMSVVAFRLKSRVKESNTRPEHRWYVACNVCDAAESLEDLLEKLYPTMGPLKVTKRIRPLFDEWWLRKRPLVLNVEDLLRTHPVGEAPQIGDLVHFCETAQFNPFVYILKFNADDVTQLEAAFEGEQLPPFTVLCPGCYTGVTVDELESVVDEKIWTKRDRARLNQQIVIYKTIRDFVDYAETRDTPEEPEEDDLILACHHIEDVDDGSLFYVENSLDETYDHPEEGSVVVSWLLVCDECNKQHMNDTASIFNHLNDFGKPIIWGDDEDDYDYDE